MHLREKRAKQPHGRGQNGGEGHAQVNTVEQGTMTVLAPARSESLRNQRVQSHEQAATEKSQDDKNVGAQTDRAHCGRTVGKPPYHHRIDDSHAHPAEFGEHKWNGEPQRGAEFGAKCLESDHGYTARGTSVSGAEKRSKRTPR